MGEEFWRVKKKKKKKKKKKLSERRIHKATNIVWRNHTQIQTT
jgi:hypothetical protein